VQGVGRLEVDFPPVIQAVARAEGLSFLWSVHMPRAVVEQYGSGKETAGPFHMDDLRHFRTLCLFRMMGARSGNFMERHTFVFFPCIPVILQSVFPLSLYLALP
jgi:hypothetical protein